MTSSTDPMRFSKSIRRITVLERDESGRVTPNVLYERSGKKQRQSPMLKPVETFVRRAAEAGASGAERYVVRHRRSNRKRRNGWLRDVNVNLFRALRRGAKDMKMRRWMMM